MYNRERESRMFMNNITVIQESKFKDILVSLRFANQDQSSIIARAVLAIMLSDRSSNYNTKVLMNEKLDNMFGANLSSAVFNYGQAHVIELSFSVLSSKFVSEDLLDQQVEFLSELVYKPLLNEASFTEAKLMLTEMIERESDNLGSYVVNESLKVAGKGFPLEASRFGDLEVLNNLELEDIEKAYEMMISGDSLKVHVVGDVTQEKFEAVYKKYFKHHNTDAFKTSYTVDNNTQKTIEVTKDIPSPYFSVVYNTHTSNKGREYWAMQLMSMVLGQLPNSFLFHEVREKRSLCYFIRSMVAGYDGVMIVTSGVRDGSEDEAISLIDVQIERIINYDVSEDLFNSAKRMMVNTITQTEDSNRRIVDSQYRKYLLDEKEDSQGLIDLINDIKIEELIEIAKRLEHNVTYKLVKGA